MTVRGMSPNRPADPEIVSGTGQETCSPDRTANDRALAALLAGFLVADLGCPTFQRLGDIVVADSIDGFWLQASPDRGSLFLPGPDKFIVVRLP
jgi:hypothetical protein